MKINAVTVLLTKREKKEAKKREKYNQINDLL
jgi:hypothetical protein